ncbi:MAG: hypothetical protein DWQ08_12325 [Proteobacteria bacterium]|nr:MAG: hypothetical protein DWQ08_12325 [Pseudomonadota bacterium]
MDRFERLSELIESIYSAPFEKFGWSLVLRQLCTLFESDMGHLHVPGLSNSKNALSILEPFVPDVLEPYFSYYCSVDPRFGITRKRDNRPRTRKDLVDDAYFRKTEIYNDFLRPLSLEQSLVVPLEGVVEDSNFLSLLRSERRGPYTTHDIDTLAPLVRHIQKAVVLQRKLIYHDRNALESSMVLDRIDHGIAFVDASRRVVHMNRAAQAVVESGDSLGIDRHGFLYAADESDENKLATAIDSAIHPAAVPGLETSSIIPIRRENDKRPLEVMVSPALPERYLDIGRNIRAVLVIADPEARIAIPGSYLKERYGLTVTECNIALALANGITLNDYCEQANVSLSTARTQLKRLLHKCGVKRQPDLIRLLLRSPLGLLPKS